LRRLKLILAAAAAMAVMMVAAAPAMADEHWGWGLDDSWGGFDDPWYLADPTANSDDVEVPVYWGGDWYLVEYDPEWAAGEWTWVVDDVEAAEDWWA
jgi:hypothetical protein